MANVAAGSAVYQQMIVPAPYHYQTQQNILTQNVQQTHISVQKKETKKRKKPAKEVKVSSTANVKKSSNTTASNYASPLQAYRGNPKNDCSRCNSNRKKCYRHFNLK